MKILFNIIPISAIFLLVGCGSRSSMASSNYKSKESYEKISSCFIRIAENQNIVGKGPNVSVISLRDPTEIQVADIYSGVYYWEVDFMPLSSGSSIIIRGYSLFGNKKSFFIQHEAAKLERCGKITQIGGD
ncbi:MAG: hypothetical protein PHT60_09715 [Acidiphilium sp.]|nr:hypothetical protein [Acidiphilium sp.]MDD4936039.1 hypothetical protein [Acidiphilium sp.]